MIEREQAQCKTWDIAVEELRTMIDFPSRSELLLAEPPGEWYRNQDPDHDLQHHSIVYYMSKLYRELPLVKQSYDRHADEASDIAALTHDLGKKKQSIVAHEDHAELGASAAGQLFNGKVEPLTLAIAMGLIRSHITRKIQAGTEKDPFMHELLPDPYIPIWYVQVLRDADKCDIGRVKQVNTDKFAFMISVSHMLPIAEELRRVSTECIAGGTMNGFRSVVEAGAMIGVSRP